MALDARRTVSLTMAVLAIVGLASLFSVVRRLEPGVPSPSQTEEAVLSARDAVMLARDRGRLLWRLRVAAIGLRRSADADLTEFHTAVLDNVHEGMLYRDGHPEASFSAQRATYQRQLRLLDVEGGIRLQSHQGETFAASRCQWSEREGIVRFLEGGTATIRQDKLTAPVMLYEPRNKVIRCPAGASATVRGHAVAAAILEWDLERRWIRCEGPITGSHGRAHFVAQRAELDLNTRILRVNNGSVDLRMDSE